jgi:hypothetical protein
MNEYMLGSMFRNGKTTSLVATALLLSVPLLSGGAIAAARAESAYPNVQDLPPKPEKPGMTVDEQAKLKKELNDARDRQSSRTKAKDSAARPKSLKPK